MEAVGFVCGSGCVVRAGNGGGRLLMCAEKNGSSVAVSRRAVLGNAIGAAIAAAGLLSSQSAQASDGIQGGFTKTLFPKAGFNSPSELTPGSVSMDKAVLKDPAVQKGLSDLQAKRKELSDLQAQFKADSQLDVVSKVNNMFNISKLRDDLNKVNSAFDEETQIQTDRVVRNIIQDISELNSAAKLKPDVPRTPKKIEKTNSWMSKLASDFDKLLAFY
uniref:Uncharacterized protein n=1 Tax=Timspurckia oligopyrenoides TaxID=708627 RepID=A0A6T6NYL8_9RHOD|mmetsp:Transcript_5070/g.8840  ORF Transcript_5070/g.8840 Transcript_5070/m.8840 type:complete len:218 (+) Transcript_5070:84-737(+)